MAGIKIGSAAMIDIGYAGEHMTREIVFDAQDWMEKHPGCEPVIVGIRADGEEFTAPDVRKDEKEKTIIWTLTAGETIAGDGEAQLLWMDGERIAKKAIMITICKESLATDATVPDAPEPTWAQAAMSAMQDAQTAADQSQAAKADAIEAKNQAQAAKADAIEAKNQAQAAAEEASRFPPDQSIGVEKLTEDAQKKVVNDYITPEMFGAAGDGVTDDTDAFVAALDYVNASNSRIQLSGTYLLGNRISLAAYTNIRIEGMEYLQSWNTRANQAKIIAPNGLFDVPDTCKITIKGVNITVSGVEPAFIGRLNNCYIGGCNIDAKYPFRCGMHEQCVIEKSAFGGVVVFAGYPDASYQMVETTIYQCYVYGYPGTDALSEAAAVFNYRSIERVKVYACYFDRFGSLFSTNYQYRKAENLLFSGCTFEWFFRVLTGEFIEGSANKAGQILFEGCSFLSLRQSYLLANSPATAALVPLESGCGVLVSNSSDDAKWRCIPRNITIVGCAFSDSEYGMYLNNTYKGANVKMFGNTYSGVDNANMYRGYYSDTSEASTVDFDLPIRMSGNHKTSGANHRIDYTGAVRIFDDGAWVYTTEYVQLASIQASV